MCNGIAGWMLFITTATFFGWFGYWSGINRFIAIEEERMEQRAKTKIEHE